MGKRGKQLRKSPESGGLVAKSSPTLCVSRDCSPPGSSVHGGGKKDNSQRKLPPSPAHPQVKWPRNSHVSLKMSSTDGHSTQW